MKSNKFNLALNIPKNMSVQSVDTESQSGNEVDLTNSDQFDHLDNFDAQKKLEEILQWFQERNIKQGNPEDLKDDILEKAYSGRMNGLANFNMNSAFSSSKPKKMPNLKFLSKENLSLSF